MADDWKPGDLALCVRAEVLPPTVTVLGGIYTVTDLTPDGGLLFAEVYNGRRFGPPWYWGFSPARFRKIHPLNKAEHAAAMRELNTPVREPADVRS